MKININRDIEEAYKDQFMKGFTMRETGYIALAFASIILVAFVLCGVIGVPITISVYVSLPFGVPALLMGFKNFQGLTVVEYIKELLYEKKIQELYYDADEYKGKEKIFSMKHEEKKG